MYDVISFFAIALTAIFVVVEPFGVVPIFASLTKGQAPDEVSRIALRASVVGAAILILSTLFGHLFLEALHVRIDAFRMAGGLLLLLPALDMLRAKTSSCQCSAAELEDAAEKDDIAIVPLAIPMLAGPGAMATVMVLVAKDTTWSATALVLAAVLVAFIISYFVLRSATLLQRVMGRSVMSVTQRVLGLVLAAMSIQLIFEGGTNLLATRM